MENGRELEADLIIIGGGPAGLTVAREFFGHQTRVLVLESGRLEEDARIGALNRVESVGEPSIESQVERRAAFHGASAQSWSPAEQPYGVRCRVLGGSSHAWAGKSAAFDSLDFESRSWVPYSGWPIARAELEPHIDRAAEQLNLGPSVSGDGLWSLMGCRPPEPQLDAEELRPFFWQFARSRIDRLDVMRFGPEFMREDVANVRTLLNATVTRILTNDTGSKFEGVEVACLEGVRARVRGKVCVLAASGVENARLLMASNQVCQAGIGNDHDVVGRFLLDHPSARLGRYDATDAAKVVDRFGFYGLSHAGRTHMYMHGLALPRSVQEREGLLNCALYILEERAPDDPLEALKRLLARKSSAIGADLGALVRSPGLLAKGVGMKALQGNLLPERVKTTVVNAAIKLNPNLVVREHLNRGIPHKLTGLAIEGISEQKPDPDSRITLAETKDELGVARAKINWKIDRDARRSLARLGQQMSREFGRVGLPPPTLDAWVERNSLDDAAIIDMAHTMGTTRIADDPKQGVVDRNCRVHGVGGLYIAGASVFPTGGHANPTLMILALAIRLSDHLKHSAASWQNS